MWDGRAAALAYYLLFTLFPFLIFLSSLLGLLNLDVSEILGALQPLLPAEVLDVAEAYLEYASRTSSAAMLWFGRFSPSIFLCGRRTA